MKLINEDTRFELMRLVIETVFKRPGGTWSEVLGAYRDCLDLLERDYPIREE
jgi:hypothetical protein